jgi:hypothetical protein
MKIKHGLLAALVIGAVTLVPTTWTAGRLHAASDDRLAGVVDRVRDRVLLRQRDPRYERAERARHAVERVVIVVRDDHAPVAAQPEAGAGDAGALDLSCPVIPVKGIGGRLRSGN